MEFLQILCTEESSQFILNKEWMKEDKCNLLIPIKKEIHENVCYQRKLFMTFVLHWSSAFPPKHGNYPQKKAGEMGRFMGMLL